MLYCPPFIWVFVTLLCKSQSLLVNGKEIRFILIIIFSLEMGKTFSLLYFCLAETRKDIMEMCWHGTTGAETGQDRVSGETRGSRCWHKQQECPPLATSKVSPRKVSHLSRSSTIFPQDPFELCWQPTSSYPLSSVPQMCNRVATDMSPFSSDHPSGCWFDTQSCDPGWMLWT